MSLLYVLKFNHIHIKLYFEIKKLYYLSKIEEASDICFMSSLFTLHTSFSGFSDVELKSNACSFKSLILLINFSINSITAIPSDGECS